MKILLSSSVNLNIIIIFPEIHTSIATSELIFFQLLLELQHYYKQLVKGDPLRASIPKLIKENCRFSFNVLMRLFLRESITLKTDINVRKNVQNKYMTLIS